MFIIYLKRRCIELPEVASKDLCTGCTACASICPQKCICMTEDIDGFTYPKIANEALCISCGACEQICPILNQIEHKEFLTKSYAALSKSDLLRMESSSGGIFSELSKIVIQSRGIVYGASYDKNNSVEHIGVDNIDDLGKLRGAKYSQSNLGNSFLTIKKQLDSGINVLFSGTPCQIGGLKAFLKKDYENLLCIDFVCHGVPSPLVWKKYVNYRAKIDDNSNSPDYINLRNKESGWSKYSYSVEFHYTSGKRYICNNSEDVFMKLFVNNYILRRSCSACHFKGYGRFSDITLGDFWGIWDINSEMDDNKGTSLVLINSLKGEELFRSASGNIKSSQVTLEQASIMNPSLLQSSHPHSSRDKVLSEIIQNGFETVIPLFQSNQSVKTLLPVKIRNMLSRLKKKRR